MATSGSLAPGRKARRQKWWTKHLKANNTKGIADVGHYGNSGSQQQNMERGKVCLAADRGKEGVLKHTCSISSTQTNSAGFKSQTTLLETESSLSLNDTEHDTRKKAIKKHTPTKSSKSLDHNITHTEPSTKSTVETLPPSGRRYIAFVGNLPFTATREDIIQHFHKKGVTVTEVRLLTKRDSGESRGCCFLELPNAKTLQNALKFHHTLMQGRRLNVEVTCGGGGKSESRLTKIKNRNEKLRKSRTKPVKIQ